MRRRLAADLLVWLASCTIGASAALGQDLEHAVADAEALGARTGIAVCDDTGHVLYRHRVNEAFAPASNMKLLTAAAVLSGLGPDFAFVTRFAVHDGQLVVTASGDPNWIRDTDHAPSRVFAELVAALRERGVRSLRGIELDVGNFRGPTRPPTWPQDQLYTYYCAPTGPFVLEQGTFVLRLQSAAGATASVQLLAPPDAVPIEGSVELVDKAKGATYGALDRGDRVTVRGRFWRKSPPVEIRTAMDDPMSWYRKALEHALIAGGIPLAADAAVDAAANGTVLEHKSDLRAAMQRMLEDSSNFDAEQLLRVLGSRARDDGSLAGGVAALEHQVHELVGQIPAEVVLVDGSGLSKQNRLTPAFLLVALFKANQSAAGALLRACLPVAGQSGTLTKRFSNSDLVGRVHAKTGWINGASALTGFVDRKDGSVRWFSILMDYEPSKDLHNKELKQLQERIVEAVDAMEVRR